MTSTLQKAEDAHELYQQLIDTVKLHRASGIALGVILWRLKADNAFKKAIGSGIDSWEDFLKMPEIGLDVREANRAIDLYETFVIKYKIDIEDLSDAKTKSLHYLLPVAKTGAVPAKRIRELVDDAKVLTQNQFRENIYDAKDPNHGPRTYQFVLMRKCHETGTLQKVHGWNHEQLVEVFSKAGIHLEEQMQSLPDIL